MITFFTMEKIKYSLVLTLFAFLYIALCPPLAAQKPLKEYQKKWAAAPGVITKVWDVTNSSNNLGVELRISPTGEAPFTAQIHHVYSFMEDAYDNYKPGKALQVRYDAAVSPFDSTKITNKVVIEKFVNSAADSMAVQRTLSLLKCDSVHRQVLANGLPAQAVVLEYKPYENVDLRIKGNNPEITLRLEVKPEDKNPFKATVEGIVILEASIPKYQPGKILYVKYDPDDLTKVAVDHSE